jgi:hypothetical protein
VATDLSDLAADSVWATSQHAGTTSDRSAALAAPGTPSPGADPAPEPFVRPIDRRAQQLTTDGQDGEPVGPIAWTRAGD